MVDKPESELGGLLHGREYVLFVGQRRLRLAALCDVLHRANDPIRAAVGVEKHFAAAMDVALAAVGPAHPVQEVVGQFAAHGARQHEFKLRAVRRMDTTDEQRVAGAHALGCQAPQAEVLVRPLQRARHRVPIETAHLGESFGLSELLMAAPQRFEALGLGTTQRHVVPDHARGAQRDDSHIDYEHQDG